MSTTVKVFIVLNLLLALAFTWISMTLYATRENWKRRWNEDTAQLSEELKVEARRFSDESFEKMKAQTLNVQLEKHVQEQQADLDKRDAMITEQKQEIQGKELTISKMQADIAAMREDINTLTNTLEQTRQRNTELTHIAQVARAVAFQLNVKLAEVEDDYNNATTELQQRDEDIAKLTKDLKTLQAQMAQVRDNFPDVFRSVTNETASGAFIQGIVAAVRVNPQGQQDLVMLSVGKEEGIQEGMEFIVFRSNQYVVKVRAERVINDMVACRVIPNTWNTAGAKIQQGDLAQ